LKAGLENAALKDCFTMHVLEATIWRKIMKSLCILSVLLALGIWGCPENPRPRPMNLAGIACAELIRSDWDFPEEPHLRGSEALRFIQHETGAAAPASPTVRVM
jgi:hypothetical protein